ncbi:DUF1294 domain-containing protein [Desulforamulus hydrothermalis]|uniref:DUF1294 domain-containing protein n=1 Tax=Desulforamulus hydrothermalis Lam5 = DSM 18033 TaxID=1121428 RepID=K8DXN7_9FIRM|nr:DUF1294 domain-containing protein [Desulforamulus hydrothermalis]CCO07457.1 conserved membrane hypothetical protein [Desulforamulus hydrothermalis Lam5 = DSM 18033]SHH18077.1 Uncharacterized membrane protein YsdA, DUF1294 family [Desulforamulus hydrothermalis Lam5 = DSM 18033]
MGVLATYLIGINILTFIMFNLDKWYASTGGWRISERSLLIACLAGGALGGYLGMKYAHHKTKKALFSFGLPALGIAQLVFLIWIL